MHTDILLGLQWGDEGKGKIVDFLAPQYEVVARFQGGPNAGHTLYVNGRKIVLHLIPSGIFHENSRNLIGNGVVVDPIVLKAEVENLLALGLKVKKNLFLSNKAHLILPTHKILDAASESKKGKSKIGSTLRGIGPAYMDKTGRNGLRVGDCTLDDFQKHYTALKDKHLRLLELYNYEFNLSEIEQGWMEGVEFLRSLNLVNGEYFINSQLSAGKKVLAEGAQGSMLDIDYGTYPFVTSSNTIASAACTGLGIAPARVKEVIGITKAYATRVGSGPFPTELTDEAGERLRKEGAEFGATTGRPRRCGWLDLPALKYTAMLSGLTQLVITKIDVLNHFETIRACTGYHVDGRVVEELPYDVKSYTIEPQYHDFEGWQQSLEAFSSMDELPPAAKDYLRFLEKSLDTTVAVVSNGPGRDELIVNKMPANPA